VYKTVGQKTGSSEMRNTTTELRCEQEWWFCVCEIQNYFGYSQKKRNSEMSIFLLFLLHLKYFRIFTKKEKLRNDNILIIPVAFTIILSIHKKEKIRNVNIFIIPVAFKIILDIHKKEKLRNDNIFIIPVVFKIFLDIHKKRESQKCQYFYYSCCV